MSSLLNYLPAGSLAIVPADLDAALANAWNEISERYEQRRHDTERPVLRPDEICCSPAELLESLQDMPRIIWQSFEWPGADETSHHFASKKPPSLNLDPRVPEPASALKRYLESFDGRMLFVAESAGRRETLIEILADHDISLPTCENWPTFINSDQKIAVTVAPVLQGMQLERPALALIAEDQLFGERARQSRRRRRAAREPEQIIRDLTDLREGSPVVHEDYGVGRYLGLVTKEIDETPLEMLILEYAGGDKLYVPVHALQLISRYTGGSPDSAPLHQLGGTQWQRIRQKARERIRDVAAELLELYATRESRTGHRCEYDEQDYRAFISGFPFEETADQEQAIEDVLLDLRESKPMDRVVCGDVGFGKTEVALRAAFAAVSAGNQVALLVPTTLLAQQHYRTFCDRFADWPFKIEMLSRFRKGKQVSEITGGLKDGTVDIVVGTHRLLQPGISFASLGLVIIDEEQRFGVRHKERLKSLRAEVDVLTLTATPIPRTLNMAMGGLREMSLIATPPAERHAIKTFVSQWNDALIKEACMREVRRGGQIFFVHNEVRTIENMAARLGRLMPDLSIRIGHGQMREIDLEQVMLDFYHQRFNILLCTTIIESGLDLPTANTIIINRADKFGLAQLHQLRGRVGRSHHRAYAYLIAPPLSTITPDAAKRLEAIESLEDLGAGFTLATHDLEIRGAGELLGEEQSGQIHELGFSLYMDMLKKAVDAMRSGQPLAADEDAKPGTEAELRVAALIPEDYLPDVHLRLILYKRIANADNEEALRELQVEMIDRFGLLPAQVKSLFRLARIKLRAAALGIRRVEASAKTGSLWFSGQTPVEPLTLIRLIREEPTRYRLDGQDRLRFSCDMPDDESRFAEVESVLSLLAAA
jgi:transcription-repair coupling factor (superfamily II helicase)